MCVYAVIDDVSIHAPYIGSDVTMYIFIEVKRVSIHAPYIGSDYIVYLSSYYY